MAVKTVKQPAKQKRTQKPAAKKSDAQVEQMFSRIRENFADLEASGELEKSRMVKYVEIIDGFADNNKPSWYELPSPLRNMVESLTELVEKAAHRRLQDQGKLPADARFTFNKTFRVNDYLADSLCEEISRICMWASSAAKIADFQAATATRKLIKKPAAKK